MRSVIQTKKQLEKLQERLATEKILAFDTETTGLEYDREMVGFSVACSDTEGWYVPVGHIDLVADNVRMDRAEAFLASLFMDPERTLYIHNAKFDLKTVRNHGIDPDEVQATIIDTMVMAHVIAPSQRKSLKILVKNKLKYEMREYKSLSMGKKGDPDRLRKIPVAEMAPYAIDDVIKLFELAKVLEAELADMGEETVNVFKTLEMPMVYVIEEMEENGFLLDHDYLHISAENMAEEMEKLKGEISDSIGGLEVNIGSSKWLSDTFIDKLHWWTVPKDTERGKNGHYSTAAGWLKEWAAGKYKGTTKSGIRVAKQLLRYRSLAKLLSTYTVSLIDLCDSNGRLHASFNQTGTVTGRFSSSDPNLQNIPRSSSDLPSIRQAFIAREGFVIVAVDYSQIELRLMAHFSQDETMLDVYENNGDIHQTTADACGSSRQDAKSINFGLIYGMGPHALAGQIGKSVGAAQKFHAKYFQKYVGVREYQERVKRIATRHGYTTTLIGRRRYLPGLNSDDWKERGPAERMAVNTKIQGSAADLIKIAMRNIHRQFKQRGWFRQDAFMLSQIHDELLFEVREDMVDEVCQVIREELESCVKLKVPLLAEPGHGPTWEDAK